MSRVNSRDEIKRLRDRVIELSARMTQKKAYEIAEMENLVIEGRRAYKNYDSYKSSISGRRKRGN